MTAILPGATIGVVGGGELGRMFAMAARRLGYRVHTLSPDDDTPTGQIADVEFAAPYEDLDAIRAFARGVDVVTFEFENVSAAAAEVAAQHAPVRPSGAVLHITQQRAREKAFLADRGFPVTPFARIGSRDDLTTALERLGTDGVLKTASFGYDGKGQVRVRSVDEAHRAWLGMGRQEAVFERFIDVDREVSMIGARGATGWIVTYGLIENTHDRQILDTSVSPARVTATVERRACELVHGILETMDIVGVLCVEFLLTRDGDLLINELTPRPHNSGHLTIDACLTSQFEQQLRAICALPPGSVEQLRPAAMANLLGDLWMSRSPDWAAVCLVPGIRLHLYGKTTPRSGRKMGHITALGRDVEFALATALMARETLHT